MRAVSEHRFEELAFYRCRLSTIKSIFVDKLERPLDHSLGATFTLFLLSFSFSVHILAAETRAVESSLPACVGTDDKTFNDCYGSATEENSTYEGEWKNGLKHGQGVLSFLDSPRKYEGMWFEGRASGFGVFSYEDGSVYKGSWRANQRHGRGVLYRPDGVSYSGAWFEGQLLPSEFLNLTQTLMMQSINIDFTSIKEGTLDNPGPPITETCSLKIAERIQEVTESEANKLIERGLPRYQYALLMRLTERLGIDEMRNVIKIMNNLNTLTPEEQAQLQGNDSWKSIQETVIPEVQGYMEAFMKNFLQAMPAVFESVESTLADEGIHKISEHNWCLK